MPLIRQLKVGQVRPAAPPSLAGLERYLGSRLIPGIGPAIAGRIVAHFGFGPDEIQVLS